MQSQFMMQFLDFWEYFWGQSDTLMLRFVEHFQLILIAVILAVVTGVALGLLSIYYRPIANAVLTVSQVLMTVPSLAMMAMLIPLLRIGFYNALVALILYSLLPIVRNTYTGVNEIDPKVIEAARGMGMDERKIMWKIKIPIALPVILAGIRTATVMLVGIGAIGSYIGAGGLGEFIFRGIARTDPQMILIGAIGVSVMAIALDLILGWAEKMALARQS